MGLPDVSPVPKKDSMGMDYIPVYEDEAAGPEGTVRLSPEKIQRAGVRTEPVERRVLARTIRGSGTITADEARVIDVTARFSGYVEKLFVAETGARVRKGQPLMRVRIEDPNLIARQNDLTKTLMSITQKMIITENAQRDLQYIYGFSANDMEEIRRGRRPIRSLTLLAPENGTVTEKPAVTGMRFESGELLMRTTDYSKVWAIARVAERDFGAVHLDQTVNVTPRAYDSEPPIKGKVTLLYPELDMATRTGLARVELANPDGRLKGGMYVDVSIEATAAAKPVMAVPDSAVIDSGTRQVAFVAKEKGVFEPRPVKLGRRGAGYVEILEGLSEGEDIVVRGNFLIDAESNLQSALAAFTAEKPDQETDASAGQP
jgi:Cu(I)/Ag(I) efflux system membrane fusion protein